MKGCARSGTIAPLFSMNVWRHYAVLIKSRSSLAIEVAVITCSARDGEYGSTPAVTPLLSQLDRWPSPTARERPLAFAPFPWHLANEQQSGMTIVTSKTALRAIISQ